MIRALWVAPLVLAVACGGSSGVAGPGRDAGRDAAGEPAATDAAGELAGDGPGSLDHPVDSATADAADVPDVADARPLDAAGADATDAADSGDATPTDAAGDAAGEAGPADATSDRADAILDAAGEPVSMACTAPGTCDPFDPAACGAQLCRVGADGNASCVAGPAVTKGQGDTCASSTECGDGLDCMRIGDDPGFTCQRTCPRGSVGFCRGEQRCTSFFAGCVQFCRLRDPPCDVYAQDCADPTRACAPSLDSETGQRYTGCRPAGAAARGDRCETATCARGLVCVREANVSTCRQICTGDAGALPCLAAGETCSGLTSSYQITYCK